MSTMGFLILVRWHLYIELRPWTIYYHCCMISVFCYFLSDNVIQWVIKQYYEWVNIFLNKWYYSHGNVHHSYSKELTMSWSHSVWTLHMVSHEGDTYSIMSLSDWTMCHGQTYVYMAWTWHVALSNIKASCKLTTISHPVIDSSDIVL